MWTALLVAPAGATIVNVLTPSVGLLEDGWHGSVRAGATALAGNEQRLGVDLAAGVTWKNPGHLVSVRAAGELAVAFDDLVARKAFLNARHRWLFADPVSTVLFVQGDHNAFRGLLLRDLVGAGFNLRTWRTEWTEAHLGLTLMAEHQVHAAGFVDDDAGVRARLSTYFTVAVKADDVVLASTAFFQPRVDQPENLRFLEELSATVDLTERLDWTVLLRAELDTRPPSEVRPWDLALKSGLVLGF